MLGKPTVATVPPSFTARLAATGNAANLPSALSNARSLAASTFTTLTGIKRVLATENCEEQNFSVKADENFLQYAELGRLQMENPERFAEIARTFNKDETLEVGRNQYAGKILCAARTMWDELRQQGQNRLQTFPDYFEAQYGCRPSNHGLSCAKTYRNMVLTGKIAEADYDKNSSEAIETASRVISKVADDINHPAVTAAASILRQRSRSAIKDLKALLERWIADSPTGRMTLLDEDQAAGHGVRPMSYSPALELAFNIAKEGHHTVLAAPLKEMAASTSQLEEARSLAIAAANIRASLANNRDEQGRRRFSDEMIADWSKPDSTISVVTSDSLKVDYAAAKRRVEEIEGKLKEVGVVPSRSPVLPQQISPSTVPRIPTQGITLKRWRGAEQRVLDLLRARGWQVEDVSLQKLGYDIEGQTPEGEDVFVEVKSIDNPGQAFTLTSNEEAVAREKGTAYRLALVRLTNTYLEVAFFSDPVSRLTFTRQYRQLVWECAAYEFSPERYPLE